MLLKQARGGTQFLRQHNFIFFPLFPSDSKTNLVKTKNEKNIVRKSASCLNVGRKATNQRIAARCRDNTHRQLVKANVASVSIHRLPCRNHLCSKLTCTNIMKEGQEEPWTVEKEGIHFFQQHVGKFRFREIQRIPPDHAVHKYLDTNGESIHPHVLEGYLVFCTHAHQSHNSDFFPSFFGSINRKEAFHNGQQSWKTLWGQTTGKTVKIHT